jgi:hypothetical protein
MDVPMSQLSVSDEESYQLIRDFVLQYLPDRSAEFKILYKAAIKANSDPSKLLATAQAWYESRLSPE